MKTMLTLLLIAAIVIAAHTGARKARPARQT